MLQSGRSGSEEICSVSLTDPLVPANDKINSIQQGFLCLSTEHELFDDYQIGVNPDVCSTYIGVCPFIRLSSRMSIELLTSAVATLLSRLMDGNSILPKLKIISVPPVPYCVITTVNAC